MYIPETVQQKEDYKACIDFHGHTCMGVTIGYLAAKLALQILREGPATDEELIVIVENDACCCDAIQVLTGCTFGKGNFFFLDYGKMAFTFGSRTTQQGVRLVLKSDIFLIPEVEKSLAEKIKTATATPAEKIQYQQLYETRGKTLFARGAEAFFDIEQIPTMHLPPTAPRAGSKPCDICKEMVMETKLSQVGGHRVCKGCED